VRIGVQGDADVRVTKPLLHHLRVDASLQRKRGMGVPQIVKPDSGELQPLHPLLEVVADGLRVNWFSVEQREDEALVAVAGAQR